MSLTWTTTGFGVSLGHRADGLQVARVRRWRQGWEAHYSPDGLDRPQEQLGAPVDESRFRLGVWGSAGEARAAVDRQNDQVTRRPN
jgi:hypothetical protein